jgi:hypothetical protein
VTCYIEVPFKEGLTVFEYQHLLLYLIKMWIQGNAMNEIYKNY